MIFFVIFVVGFNVHDIISKPGATISHLRAIINNLRKTNKHCSTAARKGSGQKSGDVGYCGIEFKIERLAQTSEF